MFRLAAVLSLTACTGAPGVLEPYAAWRVDAVDLGLATLEYPGEQGPGAAVADLDGDGWQDIAWVSPRGWGMTWRNQGDGSFEQWETLPGGAGIGAGDVDGDGDIDLAVVGEEIDVLLTNDGAGGFAQDALETDDNRAGSHAIFGDADGDGDLDLFVANYVPEVDAPQIVQGAVVGTGNVLYRNQAGKLTADPDALGPDVVDGLTLHAAWLDADGDVDLDLYLANDFGPYVQANKLLLQEDGALVDASDDCYCDLAQYSMGTAVGDPDNDGDADLFVTNLAATRFLANDGSGGFYDASLTVGLRISDEVHDTSWGAAFADVDQDGFEDLFVTYGRLLPEHRTSDDFDDLDTDDGLDDPFEQPDMLLLSDQGTGFADVAAVLGVDEPDVSKHVSLGDLNRDAQVDFVVVGNDYLSVYLSQGSAHAGVVVRLWDPDAADPFATGARVRAIVGDRTMTRWQVPGSQGSFGASAPEVYFGLGNADAIDVLTITWPDGDVTTHADVPPGEFMAER